MPPLGLMHGEFGSRSGTRFRYLAGVAILMMAVVVAVVVAVSGPAAAITLEPTPTVAWTP